MAGERSAGLAGGIVAYRPDPVDLKALICSLMHQVDHLVLYRNSSVAEDLFDVVQRHRDRLLVLGQEHNLGVGVAHNRIIEAAMARGIERIILFDQDSSPSPDLVGELLVRMQGLIRAGERPAIVGPRPVGRDGQTYKAPRPLARAEAMAQGPNVPVEFLISSGSLINGAAFREIGPFRDDFFIDAIDIEWCLRARAKGFTCWMATDVPMGHRLGDGAVRLPVAGAYLVLQPPARAYTFVRNQLALFRLGHVPRSWKARAAARLVAYTIGQTICASQRRAVVRSLARGWWDGLLGRLGPP
jgi:rhamnosyltransferase